MLLARRVRDLRQAWGVSQTELGEALGRYGFAMHQTTVAKLESADRPIRVNEAAALARIFKVPLAQLMAFGQVEDARLVELRQHLDEATAEVARCAAEVAGSREQAAVAEERHLRAQGELAAIRDAYEQEVEHVQRGEEA